MFVIHEIFIRMICSNEMFYRIYSQPTISYRFVDRIGQLFHTGTIVQSMKKIVQLQVQLLTQVRNPPTGRGGNGQRQAAPHTPHAHTCIPAP